MLAASHGVPWGATMSMPTGQIDRRTPDRQITLTAIEAVSVKEGVAELV